MYLLSGVGVVSNIGQDLLDWKWLLPQNTDGAPVASFVHSDEAESFQGHRIFIVIQVSIHELIGWNPFGEGAGMLPHVEIMLWLFACRIIPALLSSGVYVASVGECSSRRHVCEVLCWSWASSICRFWYAGLVH